MSRRQLRINLRWVFVLITIATCTLGYATWQRRRTLNSYLALRSQGVSIPLTGGGFWSAKPTSGDIYVIGMGDDEWIIASKTYTWQAARQQLRTLKGDIEELGIGAVRVKAYIFVGVGDQLLKLSQFESSELRPPILATPLIDHTYDWVEYKKWCRDAGVRIK
ncbi:MAG: hypothetical protein JNL18_04975 [Planctomycetaceae bacterium]|nr:hypothetical protein [Planctomycetaceae bacterium]